MYSVKLAEIAYLFFLAFFHSSVVALDVDYSGIKLGEKELGESENILVQQKLSDIDILGVRLGQSRSEFLSTIKNEPTRLVC